MACCKNCDHRVIGCHSTCKEYRQEQKELLEKKIKIRQAKAKEFAIEKGRSKWK